MAVTDPLYEEAQRLRDCLSALECGRYGAFQPPKLKGLVWTRVAPDHAWAETPFGSYNVHRTTWRRAWRDDPYPCDSIDHGKELCQADFERRVRELYE